MQPADAERRTDPDGDLAHRLQVRRPGAFEELLDRYEKPLFRFVSRIVNDRADAEDITQEVFVKVFRNVGSFRHDSSLRTWVYRIAVRESLNRRRWFFRHKRQEVSIDEPVGNTGISAWERIVDACASPFEQTEKNEQMDLVRAALAEIDERMRVAVVLRDIEGLSYQEISETLGVSLGTVKSRIMRGREAIRAKIRAREAAAQAPVLRPAPTGDGGWGKA